MSKITLKELAKLLNVSVSTVSKALNDNSEISLETKTRIKDLAKAYGYVPNTIARSLKSKTTKTIGVIIPDILLEFFSKVLYGIEMQANKQGYGVVICLSNELQEKERNSIDTLINGSVDGIILSVAEETQQYKNYSHLEKALNYNVPMVMFDRILEDFKCDKVTVDDMNGAYMATNFLKSQGCEQIAFVNPISNISVGELREIGYKKALKEHGGQPIVINVDGYSDIEYRLTEFLKKYPIDGILAADQYSGVLAINTVRHNGLDVPKDISVIGFTDGLLAKYTMPSLTVVSQHAEDIGSKAVEILINRIEGNKIGRPFNAVIKTSIVERNSTK